MTKKFFSGWGKTSEITTLWILFTFILTKKFVKLNTTTLFNFCLTEKFVKVNTATYLCNCVICLWIDGKFHGIEYCNCMYDFFFLLDEFSLQMAPKYRWYSNNPSWKFTHCCFTWWIYYNVWKVMYSIGLLWHTAPIFLKIWTLNKFFTSY